MTDLKWTPVTIRLGQIEPWSDNPRMSTKAQAERLIQSERELGQVQTVAVGPVQDNGKHPLYDGHQRVSAWFTIKGADFELTALQSNRPLTEDERRKMAVLLHTATGGWNWDKLSGWRVGELKEWGLVNQDNVKGWNTDALNVKELLKAEQETVDVEPQIDRAAELLEKWQVKSGDMFAIGEHKLICGDCTDAAVVARVMGGERASMCFTSPPYNAGISAQLSGNTSIDGNLYGDKYDDNQTQEKYLELLRGFTDLALLYSEYVFVNIQILAGNKSAFLDYWHGYSDRFADVAIWDKGHAAPQLARRVMDSRFEFVLVFGGNASRAIGTREFRGMVHNVYESSPQRHNENADVHAATMPIDLPEHFIKTFTNDGELIYEPFAGTGTTIVACQNLGRKCRAIEISPAYVSVALERMATAFPELEIKRI